jgi:DNA topoisomerase I
LRTRRSDPATPGWTRRRHGTGFRYVDQRGRPLPPADVERVAALVVPPAWTDVWICPDPGGHIQAVGTDVAGRRQYQYHGAWRIAQDHKKFDHMLVVAAALPKLRRRMVTDLGAPRLSEPRVLAAAASLIDQGRLRVGGDAYATGDDATFGVATLQARHVSAGRSRAVFCFPGKGGIEHRLTVTDPKLVRAIGALLRHRHGDDRLLAWRTGYRGAGADSGWREVHSSDINDYLRAATDCDITAKDFRTWHATVAAAVALAAVAPVHGTTKVKRAVTAAVAEVAEELGNTPTVARSSYIDPRVLDLFRAGVTIEPRGTSPAAAERAVLALLS